ncbi:hypothetical protein [uncultured Acetobacteroides sp.]|uniref:hypothetical protein n=1 Tax=uncultured Acetobacteroides sp. TaxID=1760811 RepID=UPI0029F52E4A|nr:hypothetical protein [uncultured Acetobacteroides sp.]
MESFCTKLLSSTSVRYGRDSIEYEKVGGKRTSDIKRAPRKKKKDDSDDKK